MTSVVPLLTPLSGATHQLTTTNNINENPLFAEQDHSHEEKADNGEREGERVVDSHSTRYQGLVALLQQTLSLSSPNKPTINKPTGGTNSTRCTSAVTSAPTTTRGLVRGDSSMTNASSVVRSENNQTSMITTSEISVGSVISSSLPSPRSRVHPFTG